MRLLINMLLLPVLGCVGGGGAPAPPPPPAPIAPAPEMQSEQVVAGRDADRARRRAAASQTIKTSAQGAAPTQGKALLGQ
jgi:hypothetical protein